MAGYTNSFTAIDGDLITAALFSNEYTALETAFDLAAGHTHDGVTAGSGGLIPLIAESTNLNGITCGSGTLDFAVNDTGVKTTQLSIVDGAIVPTTTNDIDLGSGTKEFKDIYSAGIANLTTIEASGLASLDGGIDIDNTGSVFSVGTTGNTLIGGTLGVTGATTLGDLTLGVTQTVSGILNDGTMAANSATDLVTQSSIVTYVTDFTLDGGTY